MPQSPLRKYFLAIVAALGWVAAFIAMGPQFDIDPEIIKKFFGEAASNQITQAGFFFTAAAWIHSGRVKREIKSNFSSLTDAINNVAESFRHDLKIHSERLDNLADRVQNVENNLNQKQQGA